MTTNHVDILGDYGALMERNASGYHIRPESELPYPAEVIRAAQEVALHDPNYAGVREQLFAAIDDLEGYLPNAELAPYQTSLDLYSVFLRTIATQEYRRLLEKDPGAAMHRVAYPSDEFERLRPFERKVRLRRHDRWLDLVTRLPHLFDEETRVERFVRWMYMHASDVLELARRARAAYDEMLDESQRSGASDAFRARLAAFSALMGELRENVDHAECRLPGPPGHEERATWYFSVVTHAHGGLAEMTHAAGAGDESAARQGAERFEAAMTVLTQLDASNQELGDAAVAALKQKDPMRRPHIPRATERRASEDLTEHPAPKGFVFDADEDGDGI